MDLRQLGYLVAVADHGGFTRAAAAVHDAEDAAAVEQHVSSGRAELGLADVTTGGHGLTRVDLLRQELFAVCPPGTRVRGATLTAAELAAMPLIATPAGTSTRRLLD